MGQGGVNGGLALRETAGAKRQRSPGHGGKAVAVGSAREGHLSMEDSPDRGSPGPVTRPRGYPDLGLSCASFRDLFGGTPEGGPAGDRGARGSIDSEQRLGGQCPTLRLIDPPKRRRWREPPNPLFFARG